MTTVLLTGFEPFDGAASNSSWDAVTQVAREWSRPELLVAALLPVTFAGAGAELERLIGVHSPDLVIASGLANGRATITPERIAINVEDARIPDNAGDQPVDRPIDAQGPAGYWTGLPAKAIVERMRGVGIPSQLSDSAGTYVCNSLMYRLMRAVDGNGIRAGFIHVPCSPELARGTNQPYLDVDTIAAGLRIAVEVSLEYDLAVTLDQEP